jgi:hypothetical protein
VGNFSRDTFDPAKNYVSVRLQQGVPLVDSDWNEMDDIRRSELREFIKNFIGDGIPARKDSSKNDSFCIQAMPDPDGENFRILANKNGDSLGENSCLVDGVQVFITQDIDFKSQPIHENYSSSSSTISPDFLLLDPNTPQILSIPSNAGTYLVYLDVWEWQVEPSMDRSHLVNDLIQAETCTRVKRSWVVRVFQENAESRLPNHSYYLLAKIIRPVDNALITSDLIYDQRRTGINLSKYLKIPIYLRHGSIIIDSQALVKLFSRLREAFLGCIKRQALFLVVEPELSRMLTYLSLQDIFCLCLTVVIQAKTESFDDSDLVEILLEIGKLQRAFLGVLEGYENLSNAAKKFIVGYKDYLNLLEAATGDNNLIKAYFIQQGIANWLDQDPSFVSVYSKQGFGNLDEFQDPADRAFAFDYDSSGKLDHLVLYRPGQGRIRILKRLTRSDEDFTLIYSSDAGGIGGYDLQNPADRVFAFDYDSSGKLDHLVLYRPGERKRIIHILKNAAGNFNPVYSSGTGIGGYDLANPADRAFAFDYDSSGKLDHLVLYRPGEGIIYILKRSAEDFTSVYGKKGIGTYDLLSEADRAFAFDYDSSGKLDHLVLYRPGEGAIYILKRSAEDFTPVYAQKGIGWFGLDNLVDDVFAYDYDSSGKLDHLVLYRPGTGIIYIVKKIDGSFVPVFTQGIPGNEAYIGGIGGYDLSSANDRSFAFDYSSNGKLDDLVLYRPGEGNVYIVKLKKRQF